jgi:amidase
MSEPAPDGLLDAFWRYEDALMTDRLDELDRLFAPGPDTLRGDAGGLLVGHATISAFRAGRGGAPARTVEQVHVRPVADDAALVIAVVRPRSGGRGQQTQLWRKNGAEWQVAAAHVSAPAPAIDATVWRVVGSPLIRGAGAGPLVGETVAVKDLFQLAGFPVGGGVPEYLAESAPARATAPAVAALLDAGADVLGIARTDEFAYSIAGKNPHYGTPRNAAVPGAIPGGSSSGAASAVALGQASIGLATDTGGSIRVPASYQGLWGLRTTHGAVPVAGLLPLSPSFDTVGWLTRDPERLAAAAQASLVGAAASAPRRFAVVDTSAVAFDAGVREAVADAVQQLREAGLDVDDPVDVGDLAELSECFRLVQAFEAWGAHGAWIRRHPDALGAEIAARFEVAAGIGPGEAALALRRLRPAAERISAIARDHILLLPSAASGAPDARLASAAIEAVRSATMRLTCIAGSAGLPALSVPALSVPSALGGRAPLGLCLVGPAGSDLDLIRRGTEVAAALAR